MVTDLEARDSNGKKIALERLSEIISSGAEQQSATIKKVLSVTIVDKLVDPRSMTMMEDNPLTLYYQTIGVPWSDKDVITISDHALGQMCSIAKIPKTHINALISGCVGMREDMRKHLICYNFNTHFHSGVFTDRKGNPTKFLHRIVRGELCGFLSRNYNRRLGTKDMLRPFIEECANYDAKPVEAFSSTLRVALKCVRPIIYEPVPGEFIAFGATYINSDFGAGSLLVQGVVLRISSGTSAVLEARLRKIHLGAVISEEEIELSAETLEKESQTHASAVRDMVKDVFSNESVERAINMVKFSIQNKVPWNNLATRMRDVLSQNEMASMEEMLKATGSGIIDLPPVTSNSDGDPEANAWWASAALGVIAGRTNDPDRKASIQELAGKILKKE